MASLPGTGPLPSTLPPLPGTTPDAQNVNHAIEALWNDPGIRNAVLNLTAELLKHPELLEWAKVGRVSIVPGHQP